MSKKNAKNTRGRIISTAWRLFYEQGYDETTIDEIVEVSETSKGSFYHYFESKDALMGTLSYVFDEKYDELEPEVDKLDSCYEKLVVLNQELFSMVENSIDQELLARLLSTQLITRGERHLLDKNRTYYKILRKICSEGQEKGEFRKDITINEMVKLYAVFERGLLYDWCMCGGEYSLRTYGEETISNILDHFLSSEEKAYPGSGSRRLHEEESVEKFGKQAEKAHKKKIYF